MAKLHCFLSLTIHITDINRTDCFLCINLWRVGPLKQYWNTMICKSDDEVEMRNSRCRDGNESDNIMGTMTLFSHRKPSDVEKYKQAGLISRVKCGTLMWKQQKKTGAISRLCSGDEGPGEVLMRGVEASQRPLTDRRTLFMRCFLKCCLFLFFKNENTLKGPVLAYFALNYFYFLVWPENSRLDTYLSVLALLILLAFPLISAIGTPHSPVVGQPLTAGAS